MIGLFLGEKKLPLEILKSLKKIINFINSDKKRPISLPLSK